MRSPLSRRKPPMVSAFTLIELLTAMTVLALLTLTVAQLVNSTVSVTTGNRKHLDADGQARVVFDRMALDFGKMLKRTDVQYLFAKIDGGSDKMFFYSEAPAYYDPANITTAQASSVALAGYRINAARQLERLGKRLTWDSAAGSTTPGGVIFLSPPAGGSTSYAPDNASTLAGNWPTIIGSAPGYDDGSDEAYHSLAEQTFRLEYCYQMQDGTFSTVPVLNAAGTTNNLTATKAPMTSDDASTYATGSRWFDRTGNCAYVCVNSTRGAAVWKPIGLQDVRAIVVAIAVLDATSGKIVPPGTAVTIGAHQVQPPQLEQLALALADAPLPSGNSGESGNSGSTEEPYFPATNVTPATMPARLMAEAWNNRLRTLLVSSAPPINRAALAQVRVYQRFFALNTNATGK